MTKYDYIIVGGGIVGMSTAWQLGRSKPTARILVLEKEDSVGSHQTSRNSGVIHAGIYYQPGSMKADFCHRGVEATMQFCRDFDVPYLQCGKLLVATNNDELERMDTLFDRCQINDSTTTLLSRSQLKQREPIINGEGAIFAPRTGIVDYRLVCNAMAEQFVSNGGDLRLQAELTKIEEHPSHVVVSVGSESFDCDFLIACCGLMADRIASLASLDTEFQVIPFRGEFYKISAELVAGLNHLVYPIPNPSLPFLGVHLTRRINGDVIVGPNALLSLKREGYGKFEISAKDMIAMASFPGFWKVIGQNLGTGMREITESWFKSVYIRQIRKFLPQIKTSDLQPFPPGIRAQAVMRDGTIFDDFLFAKSARTLHVCNAPSPAATSAIPIGQHICEQVS
jgi:L-2-hydroxyglutarate oxidase